MKSTIIKILVFLIEAIRIVLRLFIFLLIIVFISQFVSDLSKYPYLVKINSFEQQLTQPLVDQIKLLMPYKYRGVDYSAVILLVLSLIISNLFFLGKNRILREKAHIQDKKNYETWRQQAKNILSQQKIAEIDNKFEELNTAQTKPVDRRKILREFATLKSQLDSMGQQLAFLAIDVVDSAGMKRNEDKYLAAYDFDRYNELLNETLKSNGVLKFARTPDGIMSCFRTVDDAVNAAQSLIDKLKVFNAKEKKIKQNFQVRCGINAGFVYMDDEIPLEHISDHVIDIAGHMQKYAKPDCINIAASAIEPLKSRIGFNETSDVIDDQKVFQWSTK
jgi:class 3 adenylate cyclase